KLPLSCAITLGAVATATAPAATLMVVKQYKADGPLTKMLLPVVALDDVVGLIVFAISFGIAKALEHGALDIVSIIVNPLVEVVASLILGALIGLLFHFTEQFFHSRSKRMTISVTYVFLAVALSMAEFHLGPVTVEFSSLLVCMMMGTIFCNLCDFSEELMDRMDRWTGPIMVLFFVISGADLEFSVFSDWAIILVGVVYILFRSAGKIVGANISAKFMKTEPTIQKYLGITLLPQAGVALGMTLTAMSLGEPGVIIRSVALFAVLVYELVGPLLTRIALEKAGEITEKPIPARMQAKLDAKK
ncbi:MAG: cation:proton antiporter, partial [Clostridia bacterium]|nr:cation:proton antiporter [Clostridia bacterium]